MTPNIDFYADLATLDWQIDLGADEAIGDTTVNRYEQAVKPAKGPIPKTGPNSNIRPIDVMPAIPQVKESGADIAKIMAARCEDLASVRDAMAVFDHCALKKGARNLVFSDGNPAARVMVIGEAPDREEDIQGLPFVGRVGQMLDKMFAAIDLSRTGETADTALYITNVMPWRPPQNRDPSADEIAMMRPFLERHIELANPDFIVPMGNMACHAVIGKTGISRLRGTWIETFGKPTLPMFHPATIFRDAARKRDCWADLLDLKAKLTQ